MELGPIAGIRGVSAASAVRVEREIEPPFALDRSERLEEDAFHGSETDERGMEQEEGSDAAAETSVDADEEMISCEPKSRVSLFA